MTDAKICGLTTPEAIAAAARSGAGYIGFVFFPRSPRNISPARAATLARHVPAHIKKVGVFVDADDDFIADVLQHVDLDILQLHGTETPARVTEIKTRFHKPVMKAIAISGSDDIATISRYDNISDYLLFDAKAPKTMENALPGGNGLIFDWTLLANKKWQSPWMLSGGLDAENVRTAINISKADIVDVSSGVESTPGVKDLHKISTFLDQVIASDQ
ncbi:MAG: phosphoribosylanthranilate isomerase [Kordiimonas sp.]|nr:phosphoribosylanthranilate isomerase [Kordiimonas sp.]|tara:strand:+ start:42 stop:692 length:651 start_codon:yes stop_codon:yes gene_type:complete